MRKKYQQYPNNRFLKITKQIQEVSLTCYHNWERSKPEAKTSQSVLQGLYFLFPETLELEFTTQ